jgi:hypothetical protein
METAWNANKTPISCAFREMGFYFGLLAREKGH